MMKKVFYAIGVVALIACSAGSNYGADFDSSKAVSVDDAIKAFKSGGNKAAVVKGAITAVCQSEGCWFSYKTTDGDVRVDFDHKFKIPKDSKGSNATASGYFFYDTTSVDQLKEWAKDDKKSEAEIAKITEPEINLMFHADGVKISK